MKISAVELKWAKLVTGKKVITTADWLDLQFTDKYQSEKQALVNKLQEKK